MRSKDTGNLPEVLYPGIHGEAMILKETKEVLRIYHGDHVIGLVVNQGNVFIEPGRPSAAESLTVHRLKELPGNLAVRIQKIRGHKVTEAGCPYQFPQFGRVIILGLKPLVYMAQKGLPEHLFKRDAQLIELIIRQQHAYYGIRHGGRSG